MNFRPLYKYRCKDGRIAHIVSPITDIDGRKECLVTYLSYKHIAVISEDGHTATIYNLDCPKDVNTMSDKDVIRDDEGDAKIFVEDVKG